MVYMGMCPTSPIENWMTFAPTFFPPEAVFAGVSDLTEGHLRQDREPVEALSGSRKAVSNSNRTASAGERRAQREP